MTTRLAKKAGIETPVAVSDDAHAQLIADPAIPQFTQDGTLNAFTSFSSGPSTISSTTPTGFNSSSSFNSSTTVTGFTNGSGTSINTPVAAVTADILVKPDAEAEHWINTKWRPAMGWLYMATCAFDFILFPIGWSILQAISKGSVTTQWQPVTLQGAGLYHIAMGAVLGIAAYGRTKEKVSGTS
jgi:hypothetical protein